MGWVQLQSYQGNTVVRLSCCGRQVGHNVDMSLWLGTSAVIKNVIIWIKGISGKGTCRRGSIAVCMENFALGDRGFKPVSCGWTCMYSLKSNSREEKQSWRLQQKRPVQVSWAVVSLGGHHAYRASYSHLMYMAEVMGGVNGALVCDCVYLMLIVFPVHFLVELPFLVFWLALQPQEKCVFHVHCGCTAVCCCSEGLQEASNGF